MKETISNLKKVLQSGKEYRWAFMIEGILTLIQIMIGIFLPLFLAKQIVLITDNAYNQLILTSLMILFIAIGNHINEYCIAQVCFVFRRGTTKNIQIALGKEILKITQTDIDNYGTGTFIERLNQDTDKMTEIFTKGIGYLSRVIMSIGTFIAVFLINKLIFLFYLSAAMILILLHLIQSYKVNIEDRKLRIQKEQVSGLVSELVRGEKDIKMLSAKQSFIKKLTKEITTKIEYNQKTGKVKYFYDHFIGASSELFSFILILLLIILMKNQKIDTSIAIALFTYKTNILNNFMEKISLLFEEIRNFNISTNRVFAILETKEFQKESFGTQRLETFEKNVEFHDVSFSYDEVPVLNHMTFQIHAGETVAFVGKSGSGKTTIFNLLGKLYEPKQGEIKIDGINLTDLDEDSIRGNITLISQNPYIFHMSIRENLELVKENITEEEMIDALKQSCLWDFIKNLPNGLDTIIGEGGTNLSGGQRQRLAIARALVQKTKIILFDEATSALDNETQKDLQDSIDNLKGEYTILIIAHRLSTIQNADCILVIEEGKITAKGTHKDLLKKSDSYKRLYESELVEKKKKV